jgi:hypothetical protein
MPQPFLHLGNVGVVIEGVGRGRRAKRMRPDLEAQPEGVPPDPQGISLRNRKFHLALCSPTSAITDLKEEAMGPWWKYCFFRQKSVLAHNSIWTNFRGHINFQQAI